MENLVNGEYFPFPTKQTRNLIDNNENVMHIRRNIFKTKTLYYHINIILHK